MPGPEAHIVALYQFATDKHLNRVLDRGVAALQWPVGWAEIEQACLRRFTLQPPAGRAHGARGGSPMSN